MRICLFLIAAAAFAQTTSVPPVKPLEVPSRIGILGDAKVTLNEVIQRVLANDKDLAVSRIVNDEAVLNLRGAQGYFDPRLGFDRARSAHRDPGEFLAAGLAPTAS